MTRTLLIILLSAAIVSSYVQETSIREEYITFPTYT